MLLLGLGLMHRFVRLQGTFLIDLTIPNPWNFNLDSLRSDPDGAWVRSPALVTCFISRITFAVPAAELSDLCVNRGTDKRFLQLIYMIKQDLCYGCLGNVLRGLGIGYVHG